MDEQADSPQARANRLKNIRKRLFLTRKALGEAAAVSPRNLENWEYARFNGISHKGALNIITGLNKLGHDCTVEWLMFGEPPAPSFLSANPVGGVLTNTSKETGFNDAINQEIDYLKNQYSNITFYKMHDSNMAPALLSGDHVAGLIVSKEDYPKYYGWVSIIKLKDGTTTIREFQEGAGKDHFTLISTNNRIENRQISNTEITILAPVVWVRRDIS